MEEKSNNRTKLHNFFAKEYVNIKRFVSTKIKNTAERDAEDIIQDVALNIFTKADFSAPVNDVAAYVYGSVRNKIIDLFRNKKSKNHYFTNENINSEERIMNEFAEKFLSGADNSYSENMKKHLKIAIGKLKPEYREIIIATEFEGYTHRELSEMWEISIGTLLSRRHRALAILHKSLSSVKKTEY